MCVGQSVIERVRELVLRERESGRVAERERERD